MCVSELGYWGYIYYIWDKGRLRSSVRTDFLILNKNKLRLLLLGVRFGQAFAPILLISGCSGQFISAGTIFWLLKKKKHGFCTSSLTMLPVTGLVKKATHSPLLLFSSSPGFRNFASSDSATARVFFYFCVSCCPSSLLSSPVVHFSLLGFKLFFPLFCCCEPHVTNKYNNIKKESWVKFVLSILLTSSIPLCSMVCNLFFFFSFYFFILLLLLYSINNWIDTCYYYYYYWTDIWP